jgi:hypothetical protein
MPKGIVIPHSGGRRMAISNKWIVEVGTEKHVVKAKEYGSPPVVEILVNGELVHTWHTWVLWGLKHKTFQTGGKNATLRRTGFLYQNLELFVEGGPLPSTRPSSFFTTM